MVLRAWAESSFNLWERRTGPSGLVHMKLEQRWLAYQPPHVQRPGAIAGGDSWPWGSDWARGQVVT
eukprot:5146639-Alexandrium_andersonii.AAC.1